MPFHLPYYSVHLLSLHSSHPPSSRHSSIHLPISAKLKNGQPFLQLLSILSLLTVFQALVLVTTHNPSIPCLPPLLPPFSTTCIYTHPFSWNKLLPTTNTGSAHISSNHCHFHFFLALHAVQLSPQSLHFPSGI